VIGSRRAARLALLRLAGPALAQAGKLGRGGAPAGDRRQRILLIRPDHLGDILLASPAETALRQALPDAEIDWLVGPWSAEVARRAGASGAVMTLDFPGFTRQPKRTPLEPYALLAREAKALRRRGYVAALILRPDHWWGAMLAALAGIPRRFGYSVAECTPFLTDTLPPPTGHAAAANLALARLAAVRLGGAPVPGSQIILPRFIITDDERDWASQRIAALRRSIGGNGPAIVVHPGAGAPLKSWPIERWSGVVRELRDRAGAAIVLTGGPGERGLAEQIAARLDPSPLNLAGSTMLGQLAALFARADLAIGGDSGPLHLAAALGAPTLRLYGPTDVREFGPWPPGDQHIALAAGLPCQPCRALVDPPCGATTLPACLLALDVERVVESALSLLARRPRPSATALSVPAGAGGDSC
jgi:heptosyltransferase-2/heptosyltransferase-3